MGGQVSGASSKQQAAASNNVSNTQFNNTLENARKTEKSKHESRSSGSSGSGHKGQVNESLSRGQQVNSAKATEEKDSSGERKQEYAKQVKPAKTVNEAYSRLSARMQSLSQSRQTGLAKENPVTYSLVRELGVNPDPDQKGLSTAERKLAGADPLNFGLLQYNNIRFSANRVGGVEVTANGKQIHLIDEQKQVFKSGNITAFSNSLLVHTKPDQHSLSVMSAAETLRVDYTKQKVTTLMSHGKDREAMVVLNKNLNSMFDVQSRAVLWKVAGEPHFNQDYFTNKIQKLSGSSDSKENAADKVGKWLQSTSDILPIEASTIALDVVKNKFNSGWLMGSSGQELYIGISSLVEKAPGRAPEMASWMTNGAGKTLLHRIQGYGFDAVAKAGENAIGIQLSEAINEDLKKASDNNPGHRFWDSKEKDSFQQFSGKLQDARNHLGQANRKKQFEEFNKDAIKNSQLHLNKMKGDSRIGNDVNINNDTELRNIVGRSMGYVPANEKDALANDYSQEWYAPGSVERMHIDQITEWIKHEGGKGLSVKSMPFIYASKHAGYQKSALFEVTNRSGNKVVIDGSVAPRVIAENKFKIVPAGGDTNVSWKHDSVEDYFEDNQLDPEGKVYMAKNPGLADQDGDGNVDIKIRAAADVTTWEKASPYVDTAVAVVGIVGGVLLAIPSGGTSLSLSAAGAGLLAGSMAYGLTRSGHDLYTMHSQGQDIWTLSSQRARSNWLGVGGTLLGGAAWGSGLRAGNQMMKSASATSTLARSAQNWSKVSKVSGTAGAAIGIEQMGEQGYLLATNWDKMSAQEKGRAFLSMALGAADLSVGVWAHRRQVNSKNEEVNTSDRSPGDLQDTERTIRYVRVDYDPDDPLKRYEANRQYIAEGADVIIDNDKNKILVMNTGNRNPGKQVIAQQDLKGMASYGCAVAAGCMILQDNGLNPNPGSVAKDMNTFVFGTGAEDIVKALAKNSVKVRHEQSQNLDDLARGIQGGDSAIVIVRRLDNIRGSLELEDHSIVVDKVYSTQGKFGVERWVEYRDPDQGRYRTVDVDFFLKEMSGEVIYTGGQVVYTQ